MITARVEVRRMKMQPLPAGGQREVPVREPGLDFTVEARLPTEAIMKAREAFREQYRESGVRILSTAFVAKKLLDTISLVYMR